LRVLILSLLVVAFAACQPADRDVRAPGSAAEEPRAEPLTPKVAYEQACADCHETGKNGAPRTGDAQAWKGRSALWEAVLFEHAEKGYFDMPAHGLNGRLSDDEVAAAAQYLLETTHPDQPRD
jgi:cytochrome c5